MKLILKSINPRYFREIGEGKIRHAVPYFLKLVLFCFILVSILMIPKLFFIAQDINEAFLGFEDTSLSTSGAVSIPKENPFITFDTTNNKTKTTEVFFVTDENIDYKIFWKKINVDLEDTKERQKFSMAIAITLFFLFIPGIFVFYFIAYLIKYAILMFPISIISYLVAKLFNNRIELKQTIVLSLYTASAMVIIEILTIPFFIRNYLMTFSIIPGVNYSLFAITLYLIFFVTAIRINGNMNLRF